MGRSVENRHGGEDGEYSVDYQAQPVDHHCRKLPVRLGGGTFLVVPDLLRDHLYLLYRAYEHYNHPICECSLVDHSFDHLILPVPAGSYFKTNNNLVFFICA